MPLPPLVEPVDTLSDGERARTARHAALSGLGEIGQRRIAAATVAVVGAGGLGSPVILALAAAGIGHIVVIDDDLVEHANLQRQVIHGVTDIGSPKVDSAVRAAAALSPETTVTAARERLDDASADRLLRGADLVIDGTDTFATRTDVAAACERLGIPLVWGVVQQFHAQVTVFWSAPTSGAAGLVLSDLYPAGSVGELPSCADVGVLGALCIQVGGMLSTEAVKLITGIGEPLFGRVAVIDALAGTQRDVPLQPARATSTSAAPATAAAAPVAPSPAAPPPVIPLIDLAQLRAAQQAGATVLDVREPHETATGALPGSVLLPLAELLADPGQVDAPHVVVVCAHGIRARRAAEALSLHGVDASVLTGGLAAWPQ